MSNQTKHNLPVKKLTVYKNDVVIGYAMLGKKPEGRGGKKEKITKLSRKSLAKLVFYAQNTHVEFSCMVTLTYPSKYPENGETIKGHLNTFLTWLRKKVGGVSYLWFLEFQKRGAPHFHILTDSDISGMKQDVSLRWYEICDTGDKKHLQAGTRTERLRKSDGASRYAAKYGAKREQKTVPSQFSDVGRFWGCSRDVKPLPTRVIDTGLQSLDTIADTLEGLGWEYSDSLKARQFSTCYNASAFMGRE